jgi:hypothetical protein
MLPTSDPIEAPDPTPESAPAAKRRKTAAPKPVKADAERDAERAHKARAKEDAKLAKERAQMDKDINKVRCYA